ncbi:MAG: hypothetical protein E7Z87_06210 [Cyanobacteria bacterium SIG26]|nr:hypothetical protein [Cyanobacteria bacterium SIG26]
MGMYGAGKAFSLNFARTTCTPRTAKGYGNYGRPPMQQMLFPASMQNVVQYNYDSGNNFWTGLGALLGSLNFGGILNAFGVGGGGGAQPTPTNYNPLKNLQTIGPKWTIIQEGDNKFCAVRDGYPSITGDYETVKNHILNSNATSTTETSSTSTAESTSTTETEEPQGATSYSSPGGSDWSAVAKDDTGLTTGVTVIAQDNVMGQADVTTDSTDITGKSTLGEKNSQGYPSTITISGKVFTFSEVKDGVAMYKANGGSGEQTYRLEKKSDGTYALNQWYTETGAGKANWGNNQRIRINSAHNWRASGIDNKFNTNTLSTNYPAGKTAQDVINGLKLKNVTADQLTYYNPSIFDSNGNVRSDADWSKFDIPGGSANVGT